MEFEKLDLGGKFAPEAVSDVDSDVMKLVQEKSIVEEKGKQVRLMKATSSRECSMEMLEEESNAFRRNDSSSSKSSNLWAKELDYHMKLDSCIFE